MWHGGREEMRGRNGAIVKRFDGTSRLLFFEKNTIQSRKSENGLRWANRIISCMYRSEQSDPSSVHSRKAGYKVVAEGTLLLALPSTDWSTCTRSPPLFQTHQLLNTTVVPPPCAARNASRPRILPCPHVTLMLVADGVALALEHGVSVCFPIPYQ